MKTSEEIMEKKTKDFIGHLKTNIPIIEQRHHWCIEQEMEIEERAISSLFPYPAIPYQEAVICYSLSLYGASIRSVGASIDSFIRQLCKYYLKELMPPKWHNFKVSTAIRELRNRNVISDDLFESLKKFLVNIRNPTTHPESLVSIPLGGKQRGNTGWTFEVDEKRLELKEASEEGILCLLSLFLEVYNWKEGLKKEM